MASPDDRDTGNQIHHRHLTPSQAAAFLGIGGDTLREMRRVGEIPYVNIGRGSLRETPRYDVADLIA